jgi:hypothetical protein
VGTLLNLDRVADARLGDLYQRIDNVRAAISARTQEIDRLTQERNAFDRSGVLRGGVVIVAAVIGVIAIIAILLALI